MTSEPLAGIVLAGGQSRRLGVDKARLTLHGERTLLESTIEVLQAVCDELVVVSDAPGRYADLDPAAREVIDVVRGRGPMGGLHAGLLSVEAAFALLVACDMPFLSPGLVAYMAGLPRDYEALVPRVEGRWQPTLAIYGRVCLPRIERLLEEGRNSLSELVSCLDTRQLTEDELRRHDPQGLSLFNLNEPEDIESARALLDAGRLSGP